MKKRDFIKVLGAGGLAISGLALSPGLAGCKNSCHLASSRKTWAWVHPNDYPDMAKTTSEWKWMFGDFKKWGITDVLLLTRKKDIIDQVLRVALEADINLHAWIISLEYPDAAIMKHHPSWYVVNAKGESCIDRPAYINDYRWLCPSNPEVHEFMKSRVSDLCSYNELAGIHLDYIRYPDAVLAAFHRAKYDIPQDDLIHPQFDYCYCETCRKSFKQTEGIDPFDLPDPLTDEKWLKFRLDVLTGLVNELYDTAHSNNKLLTAAVFPTPGISKFRVRQDWVNWKMDVIMPMIYQRYEGQPVEWIGQATKEGVEALGGRIPLYSGLHLAQLTPEELKEATLVSLRAGASGVALFTGNKMNDYYRQCMNQALKSIL